MKKNRLLTVIWCTALVLAFAGSAFAWPDISTNSPSTVRVGGTYDFSRSDVWHCAVPWSTYTTWYDNGVQFSTSQSTSRQLTTIGTHTIKCRVRQTGPWCDRTQESNVVINVTAPVASISGPSSCTVKDGVTEVFTNTGSTDGYLTKQWYLNGSLVQNGGDSLSRSLDKAGNNEVKLVISSCGISSAPAIVNVNVAGNNYPVVLIHGFAGWGRDEVPIPIVGGHLYYWGSFCGDLEAEMNNRGFDVYTASVGPITSVWDRACEFYSQVSGQPVNYGAGHAALNSKSINGTNYTHAVGGNARPNIVGPNNRLKNSKGSEIPAISPFNPIHIVAHSMGGQTARMVATLLKDGSPNAGDSGYLFEGGHSGCIRSITTLATPHNGTNLTYFVNNLLGLVNKMGLDVIKLASSDITTNTVENLIGYDLDLDQWNPSILTAALSMTKTPEGCSTQPRPAFTDVSLWDLSPCGALELNNGRADVKAMKADPNIYYYAYPAEQTFKATTTNSFFTSGQWYAEEGGAQCLILSSYTDDQQGFQLAPFIPQTNGMGSKAYTNDWGLNESWRENDGVVNTISEGTPSCDLPTANPNGEPGKWRVYPTLHLDHMDAVGMYLPPCDIDLGILGTIHIPGAESFNGQEIWDFYNVLFTRLWQLPRF